MPNEVTRLAQYVDTMKANPAIAQREAQHPVDGIAALASQMYGASPKPKAPVSYPEGTALMKAVANTPERASGGLAEVFSQAAKNPKLAPYVNHLIELAKQFKAEHPEATEAELGQAVFSSAPPEIKQAILDLAYEHTGGEGYADGGEVNEGFLPRLTHFVLGEPIQHALEKQSEKKWEGITDRTVNRLPHTDSTKHEVKKGIFSTLGEKWLKYAEKAEREGDPSPMQQLRKAAETNGATEDTPLFTIRKKDEKSDIAQGAYKPKPKEDKAENEKPLFDRIKEAGKGYFTLRRPNEASDITAEGYRPRAEGIATVAPTQKTSTPAPAAAPAQASAPQARTTALKPQRPNTGIAKVAEEFVGPPAPPQQPLMNPSSQPIAEAPASPQYDESLPYQAIEKIKNLYGPPVQYSPEIMDILRQGKRNEMLNTAIGMLAGTGAGLSQRNLNEGLSQANMLAGNAFMNGMSRADQAENQFLQALYANQNAPVEDWRKAADTYFGMQSKAAERAGELERAGLNAQSHLLGIGLGANATMNAAQIRANAQKEAAGSKESGNFSKSRVDYITKTIKSVQSQLNSFISIRNSPNYNEATEEGKAEIDKEIKRLNTELTSLIKNLSDLGGEHGFDLGIANDTSLGQPLPPVSTMDMNGHIQ